MMHHKEQRFACLLLAALALCAVAAEADESDEASRRAMEQRLKARAETWWRGRDRLVRNCPQCQGVGQVRWGRRIVQCPKCDGRKKIVDADTWRLLFYEMRSPAWRLRDTARDEATRAYKSASDGQRPADIDRWKIDRTELVGERHGRVWVLEDRDTTARPQDWILAEEGGKADWWLLDPAVDGAFPIGSQVSSRPEDGVAASPFDLVSTSVPSPEEGADVAAALAGVNIPWDLAETGASGNTLILALQPKKGVKGSDARNAVPGSAVAAVRALLAGPSRWKGVLLHFRTPFRDRLGRVEALPYFSGYLDRETFGQVVWANLSEEERPRVLAWRQHAPPADGDWKPWD